MPPFGDKAPECTSLWGTVLSQTSAGTKAKHFSISVYHPSGIAIYLPSLVYPLLWNQVFEVRPEYFALRYQNACLYNLSVPYPAAGKESNTNPRDTWRPLPTCIVVAHEPHLVVYHSQAKIALSVGLATPMWSNLLCSECELSPAD